MWEGEKQTQKPGSGIDLLGEGKLDYGSWAHAEVYLGRGGAHQGDLGGGWLLINKL